jgi:hypothetical protein
MRTPGERAVERLFDVAVATFLLPLTAPAAGGLPRPGEADCGIGVPVCAQADHLGAHHLGRFRRGRFWRTPRAHGRARTPSRRVS